MRAQLSSDELTLLFFNCLCETLGSVKFKPLVEKYAFFEHLPESKIFTKEEIIKYKIGAYGDTNKKLIQIYKKEETTCG